MSSLAKKVFSDYRIHAYIQLLWSGELTYWGYTTDFETSKMILESEAPIEMKLFFGALPHLFKVIGPIFVLDSIIDAFANEYHLMDQITKYYVQQYKERKPL